MNDYGEGWEHLSSISSQRYRQPNITSNDNKDKLNILAKTGFHTQNSKINFFSYFRMNYKEHIYSYLYPGIISHLKQSKDYSTSLKLNQIINSTNKNTHYGSGYQNKWVTLQIGKGRENWSAGNNIQLALNIEGDSYDYFLLSSDYNRLRVNYFHGFLETKNQSINRYISGKGIEWTNKKSLVLGFSEIVIYSGEDRSFDISYFNPISTHLEVDLNNRSNHFGTQNSNGIWQAHIDWLIFKKIRISGNLLIDEYVLDPKKEVGKSHGSGFSTKIVFSPFKSFLKNNVLSFYSSIIRIGTPTFRHGIGTNNFVNHGKPLGWKFGSDGEEINSGINFFNKKNLIASISYKVVKVGEESIINRPYEPYKDYLKGDFPSGVIRKINYLNFEINWNWKPNVLLIMNIDFFREIEKDLNLKFEIHTYLQKLLIF